MKKRLLTYLALCAAVSVSAQNSVTFNLATLNIDGLPESILGIPINPDGPYAAGSKAMGEYIRDSRSDIDVLAIQEDFNYHNDFMSGLGNDYACGTHRGNVSGLYNNTDGLGIVYHTNGKVQVSGEMWQGWKDKYGTTSNGSDELIDKGFRYYLLDFGNDLKVDFYIHHMDAETDARSNAARESNVKQLIKYILDHDNGRPVIIAGDSNCRYTRDNIQSWVFDEINSTGYLQVRDPWVDFYWYGVAPKLGTSALMTDAFGLQRGEVVDKIWYINSKKANGVKLTVNSFEADANFRTPDGASYKFADHHPLIANFTIEKTDNTDDVFVPDPVAPTGFYIRNVENGHLLTGGATWGTKAILSTSGSLFTIVDADNSGKKFLISGTGRLKFDGAEIYVDASENDDQRVYWDVNELPDHTYVFTGTTANGVHSNFLITGEPKTDGNVFFDNPTHWANGYAERKISSAKLETYHPSQLWELLTDEELTAQLVERASRTNPQDLSYKITASKIKRGDSDNKIWEDNFHYYYTHDYTTSSWFQTVQHNDVLVQSQTWGITGEWNKCNFVTRYVSAVPNNSGGTNRLEASLWYSEQTFDNIPNGIYQFSGDMLRFNIGADGVECRLNGESIGTIPEFTSADASTYGVSDELNTETIATVLFDNMNSQRFHVMKEFVVTDNKLTIRFEKTEKTAVRTCMAFDNLTLMYLGLEHNASQQQPQSTITLEFPHDQYSTLILPFDAAAPEGLGVFRATEIVESTETKEIEGEMTDFDYHVVKLGDPESSIEANYPYIVKYSVASQASKAPARADVAETSEATMLTFTGYPTNKLTRYDDNAGIMTGVMVDTSILPGHYPMVSNDQLGNVFTEADGVTTVAQYRAYISGLNADLTHSMVLFEDSPSITTGVEAVAAEASDDAPVEYFNLQGIRVMNPTQGIFIRRQGPKTEKIVL